ncbi:hypothetical protein ACOAOT_00010 [Lacrimispora sp. AGF001]|uniref:hypothetical protein n=1 Tax=Lacrimispora sp. AGF001 TaxID=3401631 RepID=UPI003B4382B2|nr:hypothetical protein [Paenibacillaceae bacterium]
MKATYQEFIESNPNYRKYEFNKEAREIFENILSKDTNIISMIEASETGKPALTACVLEIENYYDNSPVKEFDLEDNFTKQGLGRMVKKILEPFGYTVVGQKDMPKALNTRYVVSASTYKLTETPKLKIVKTIVNC